MLIALGAGCTPEGTTVCERTGQCVSIDDGAVPIEAEPPLQPAAGFVPPVATPDLISSTFGPRWKLSAERDDFHLGIDYYGALGTPLIAIGSGKVYGVYPNGSATYPNGGNVVVIEHAMPARMFHGQPVTKFYAVYLHTDTMLVTTGQAVTAGQRVATMGMTGDTDFVHLHFETRVATTCSLEYQLAHPTSSCVTGFDPHVHPYLFVGGANADQIRLEQQPGNDFVATYSATRGDLDLDVIATDLGTLDFVTREGLDATSAAHLDDFDYGWLRLVPLDFRSGTETLAIELHFPRAPAFIELRDIYGHGRRYNIN
jgi:peptidase M23-like protein